MVDLKYHIASIVAVFLALGMGILIGSTIVGDDLLVDQQKKVIDRLELQFDDLRTQEDQLTAENERNTNIITKYENYSQVIQPLIIQDYLKDHKIALVVCGDSDVPAGLQNSLATAGAQLASKTVVLANMKLDDSKLRASLLNYYGLDAKTSENTLRRTIAASVGAVIIGQGDDALIKYLQDNELVKFTFNTAEPVHEVIILGGANSLGAYFADSFDRGLIAYLSEQGIRSFGVETSRITYSCMENYQKEKISTVDDIDLSPGQVSLILAIDGESGNYGMKPTAQKFIPTITLNAATGH